MSYCIDNDLLGLQFAHFTMKVNKKRYDVDKDRKLVHRLYNDNEATKNCTVEVNIIFFQSV